MSIYHEDGVRLLAMGDLPLPMPPGSFILGLDGVICDRCVPIPDWAIVIVTAGCVHEHIISLGLCKLHAAEMIGMLHRADDRYLPFCKACEEAGEGERCKVRFISQRSIEEFLRNQAKLRRAAGSLSRSNSSLGRDAEVYLNGGLAGRLDEPIRFPNG